MVEVGKKWREKLKINNDKFKDILKKIQFIKSL